MTKKWLKNKVKHSKKNLYNNQNGRYPTQD